LFEGWRTTPFNSWRPLLTNKGKQKWEKRDFYSFFNNVKDGGNVKSKILSGATFEAVGEDTVIEVSMSLPSQCINIM